jgi:rhodanese-related sulfurtransferase
MQNKGISNVSALFGGLDAWRNAGGQTVTGIVPQ